jgi:hypothetical protein
MREIPPHPWSVWIDERRLATTRYVIDAAAVAVMHGHGATVHFAGWIVGVAEDDTDIAEFAEEIYNNAAIRQCNALHRLKRSPVVATGVKKKGRRSA